MAIAAASHLLDPSFSSSVMYAAFQLCTTSISGKPQVVTPA
jgi:hypothetical protein